MMDDDYYVDLMRSILGRNKYLSSKVLSEKDKDLLEKYASKLFGGMESEREIGIGMVGLVKIFHKYRYERSPYHILNDAKQREISYKNQKPQKKFDAFQKKVKKLENSINSVNKLSNELKELFGSNTLHVHQKDFQLKEYLNKLQQDCTILQKQLQDAYVNPEQYVPIVPTWKKVDKEDIKFYLDNLNLQRKSKVIEAFKNEIEELI